VSLVSSSDSLLSGSISRNVGLDESGNGRRSGHSSCFPRLLALQCGVKYQLFYYPGNANLAPHILLEEAGCEYELQLVDRARLQQKTPEYLSLNPNGRIPTLVYGELVLFEAAALCLHIADRHPEAGLIPRVASRERSHFYQWLMFFTNTIQPAYMAFRYPETLTTEPAHAPGIKQAAAEELTRAFRVLEEWPGFGPFVLGAEYSACDAYLLMLAWWARRIPRAPTSMPKIRACLSRVAERPAVARAFLSEGLKLDFEA
jgi:glutathione S-transferase